MKLSVVSCLYLLLLGGCAVYQAKPISPAETLSSFEAHTLDNPALKKFMEGNLRREIRPWPPESWDLSMLSLAAVYYHPDLEVARTKLKSAEAGVITAGARPNPSVKYTTEFTSNASAGISPWLLGFGLDIPIETAGKRGYRLNRASYLAQAAGFNLLTAAWQARIKVRAALLNQYTESQSIAVLKKQETILEELAALHQQRLEFGEVSENEVDASLFALMQTQLQRQGAQRRSDEARARVASSLGLPLNALDKVTFSTKWLEQAPPLQSLPFPELRGRALLSRPDVLSALAEYEAAESTLQLEIARQYPDINIGPGYAWDRGDNKWSIGISATVPLLNRNEGPIAEAEARRAEAEARFTALQARIIGEIDQAAAGSQAALQKLATAENLVSLQREQLAAAQAMYDAGETDRVALLSANFNYHASELSRLSALTELQETIGLLENALQHPLFSENGAFLLPKAYYPETAKDQ